MKAKRLATLIAVLMFIPCVTHAGVLENAFGSGILAITLPAGKLRRRERL